MNGSEFSPVWPLTCKTALHNNGYFYGNRIQNPDDPALSVLYDNNGVICGVQAWLPHEEIFNNTDNKVRYYNVPMYQNATVGNKTHFVITAYFVDPETICQEGRTEEDLLIDGTGTGLYFQNGPTPADLIRVPKDRVNATAEGWTKNACFPGMGYHNFFGVEHYEETGCLETGAAFLMFNKPGELLGFGFHIQGVANSTKYVEYPPNLAISAILGAPVPQCVLDQNTLIGTTTMHVFFVDSPWFLNCL